MQELKILIDPVPDHYNSYIIHCEGDFDGAAEKNLEEIQKLIDEASDNINLIFDFSKLNFLNSFAIGNLVKWRNEVSQLSGKCYITGSNAEVKKSLSIVGGSLFIMIDDLETAIDAL